MNVLWVLCSNLVCAIPLSTGWFCPHFWTTLCAASRSAVQYQVTQSLTLIPIVYALHMSSIDPEDYESTGETVSYEDDFIGELFFWRERLVMAIRRQGGSKQVAVADAVTKQMIGYPVVSDLRRAKKTRYRNTTFANPPSKPAPSIASSSASATSSSPDTKYTRHDMHRLQEKLWFLSSKIYSLRAPIDLQKIEDSVDDLLKSLKYLSSAKPSDSADD